MTDKKQALTKNKKKSSHGKPALSSKAKRWLRIGSIAAVLLAAVFLIVASPYLTDSTDNDATLLLRKGTSLEKLEKELKAKVGEGCTSKVMRILRYTNSDISKRQGAFIFDKGSTPLKIALKLKRGAADDVKVTINNVRTRDELARLMARKFMMTKDEMLKALNDKELCAKYGKTPDNITALFMADTYQFLWDVTPEKVLEHMAKFYDRFWNDDRKEKAGELGLKPDEVIALAAIVEGETAKEDEKPKVARLYINRLQKHMKLQADPTVKFALGDFKLRRITIAMSRTESPWNTYNVEGLPPGPIRIPQKSTIEAVLNAPKHDYIYMCAKEDFSGYHNFTASYAEHEANAKRYQNALNERGIKK